MAKGIGVALAGKIFRLQAMTGGAVPGDVVRSARLARSGKETASDLKRMRDYLGIQQTGATAQNKSLRSASQALGKAAQIAVLADVAGRGGAGGVIAGAQMGNILAKAFESSIRSGAMNKVFEAAFKKPEIVKSLVKTQKTHSYLEMLDKEQPTFSKEIYSKHGKDFKYVFKDATKEGPDINTGLTERGEAVQGFKNATLDRALGIQKLKYAMMRGARMARAVGGYALAGYQATKAVVNIGEAISGAAGGEDLRIAQSDARIAQTNTHLSPARKEIAAIRAKTEKIAAQGTIASLLRGEYFSGGRIAERMGELEIGEALKQSGLGVSDMDRVKGLARERMFRDKYGLLGGDLAERRDEVYKSLGIRFEDTEKAVAAQAQASIVRANQLDKMRHEAAGRREFDSAAGYAAEANAELPGASKVGVWEQIEDWKRQVSERASVALWAAQNMARAGPRTGD